MTAARDWFRLWPTQPSCPPSSRHQPPLAVIGAVAEPATAIVAAARHPANIVLNPSDYQTRSDAAVWHYRAKTEIAPLRFYANVT